MTSKLKKYNHRTIEKKWQRVWTKNKLYRVNGQSRKKKYYTLVEFPYPSGEGLHVGHIRSYTAMDAITRKRRAQGFEVLYPMGWDAFGLPTENYAIKTGQPPAVITRRNVNRYRKQLQSLGFSFDWSREINTSDPNYYRWTQWMFLQFFKAGLAYKAKMPINWCPSCKIGLANEEVVDGKCERCGTPVESREKEQWLLAITKYADRLDRDLDLVDYPESVKVQQRHWIGKSTGTLIKFGNIEVFTTRPETIFGATFIACHGVADRFTGEYAVNPANQEKIPIWEAEYVMGDVGTGTIMGVPAHDERDFEFAKKHNLPVKEVIIPRLVDVRNPHVPGKKVVFRRAVIAVVKDPETGKFLCLRWKKQPWTTFVMGGVEEGEDPVVAAIREIKEETGYSKIKLVKILGEAQSEFFAAHKDVNRIAHTYSILFELESTERQEVSAEEKDIHEIIWLPFEGLAPEKMTHSEMGLILSGMTNHKRVYTDIGVLINSSQFDGKNSEEARKEMIKFVGGEKAITYKLRDWIFSRQRYWGEPIPLVWCEQCGKWQPVPDKDLPVKLPPIKKYQPTDTGESPLANIESWVKVKCPKCAGPARRETDTMPNWAGSSWYYLRYLDTKNRRAFADNKKLARWLPVNWYNGGMEHVTLHLLYSRFWHKALYDLKLVPGREPYEKRTAHGLVLAADGEKMSKSRGNVVNPDEIVRRFGTDALRLYEMFMGPFDQAISWSEDGLIGARRFLERVWRLINKAKGNPPAGEAGKQKSKANEESELLLNQTVEKVSNDIEAMKFNTAISALMILLNELEKRPFIQIKTAKTFLKLLSPFVPHLAEELWSSLGERQSIHLAFWPKTGKVQSGKVKIIIQVNGRTREIFETNRGIAEIELKPLVLARPKIKSWLSEKTVKRVIVVPDRLINFVVD